MKGTTRRYPGAKPFSSDQKGIFFGRDQDIEGLAEMINIEQTVVLHSKSGLGKSSLINAGVIPKLRKDDHLIPFSFRFGAYSKNTTETPVAITTDRLADRKDGILDKLIARDKSLWHHLKSMQLADNEKRGYLLIFDQFEELFTYPKPQIDQFAQQLAELLYTTIPGRYREVIAANMQGEKQQAFLSNAEMKVLHRPFEIKVMFAIRSDRMSLLDRITGYLPNLLKTCYELEALNTEQAEDAILTPAYLKDKDFASPTFDYEDEAIEKILDFLTKGNTQKIASFQLQILCESVERKVIKQGIKIVGSDDLGDIESLYKNYYDHQLSTITNEKEQLDARVLIEEGLIFEEEERRLTLYEGQIYKSFSISPELLRKLVDCHLIRSEPSSQGEGFNYEISHDSLVAPILKSKEKRRAAEEEYRRREEEKRQLEAEKKKVAIERKKRNRARMTAAVGFILFAIALVLFIYALGQAKKAKEASAIANEASFNVFIERGISYNKEGKLEEAIIEFNKSKEFSVNSKHDMKADSLIDESNNNKLKNESFEKYLSLADATFSNASIKSEFENVFHLLDSADVNAISEQARSRVDIKRIEFETELKQRLKDHVNKAIKYYTELGRESCRYVKPEWQKINNIKDLPDIIESDSDIKLKIEKLKRVCKLTE